MCITILTFQLKIKAVVCFSLVVLLPVSCVIENSDDNVLHIGGIFPIAGKGGWQGGQVIERFIINRSKSDFVKLCT